MKIESSLAEGNASEEILGLVRKLHETQLRLQHLTGGEIDAVIHPEGQSYLLHQAQEKLRQSETAQRHSADTMMAILNALPAHIALLDARGVIISVNDMWKKFSIANGFQTPEDIVGQNYVETCERATGNCSQEAHLAAAGIRTVLKREAEEFALEYPCHTPTEKRWFELRVTPVHDGGKGGAVVMHIDISKRKLDDELIRQSEERFHGMFAGAAAGIAISTPKGRYLQANAAYCRMLEYSETELQTMNFASVTHPDDLNVNLDLRDELLAGRRESLIMEKRYIKKSGGIMWAQTSVSATHSATGELATLIVIAEDISERKFAEEQLRSKTTLLEAQINSTLDGILVVDGEGNKILQNQRMIDLWHVPKEFADDLVDRRQLEWVTQQVKNPRQFVEKIEYLHGHPDEVSLDELELIDGRFFDRFSSPVRGKDGKLYGRIWAIRDVTERKVAEVEIRFNERRYRSLVEATTAIVWDTPASGEFIAEQPGWSAFTGQSFDELRGWGWLNAIHLEDRAETSRVWSAAIENRSRYDVEHRLRTPDHTYRNMLVRAVPILGEDGAIRQWIGIHTDITERKKAEERILEQAALLDKTRDAIMVRDLDGKVLFWNRGAEQMYGWTAPEVMGRKTADFLYLDPEKFREINELTISQGEWNGEVQQVNRAGDQITVEARWTLIQDKDGNPKSVLAINTNITERKKIEHQFLRAQRLESIGTLAGGIAHDLNNILAPILMSIQLLKLTAADAETTAVLKTIETSAKRGADIVRQVLSFARGVESKRIEVQPKYLLAEVENIINETFPKNIKLEIGIPQDIWTMEGDPTQIHQILLNLCVNARDAMPDGGNLSVSIENCVLDEHYSAMNLTAKAGRYVMINVTDSGTGMPQGIIDKIFEPFFTTKDLGEGTGLGLSTVMGIVKSHQGVIHVYSELGKGTTFKVYLPAIGFSSETTEHPAKKTIMPRGEGKTILVIEDESAIITITSKTLRTFGYEVLTASDGAEGLGLYAKHQKEISVVLTDLNMPVMNGLATIRALLRINPSVKIVATSGLNANEDAKKLSEMGVKYSLVKPYTAETLLTVLDRVLTAAWMPEVRRLQVRQLEDEPLP